MQKQINSQCIDRMMQRIEEHINMKKDSPLVIAMEGRSASGKTTLANQLAQLFGGSVVHMDDFFLPLEMRTPERFAQIGGNIHRERFQEEILTPLAEGNLKAYHKFSCENKRYEDQPVYVDSKKLVIVEGAYSMLPIFGTYYDVSVFLDIPYEKQIARILHRNGEEKCQQFIDRWIPFEERYIKTNQVAEHCKYHLYAEDLEQDNFEKQTPQILEYAVG